MGAKNAEFRSGYLIEIKSKNIPTDFAENADF
ncbi:hypothetical protein HNP24_003757 [Chryseobacterium sediminis]|uniref:Uncharacterized protein n=1 Tax=Chryseobacterium sediminis TaxID=1679494 RepID=A0ABR6Q4Q3_9FLAO|nr:hypothetical protein [Chryseobacterium sediminis]